VLGYLTPWNGAGKEAALRFAAKLTHASPVWYQLRPGGSTPAVVGRADADAHWVAQMRAAGVAVVPRFMLELDGAAVRAALRDPSALAAAVAAECADMRYDGAVLDGWAGWVGGGVPRSAAAALFRALAAALHAAGRVLILAVPPAAAAGGAAQRAPLFTLEDMRALTAPADAAGGEPVDLLSLMTYDAALAQSRPGPNAPLAWVGASLTALLAAEAAPAGNAEPSDAYDAAAAPRLLLGLNFYGYDFGQQADAVLGRDVSRLLAEQRPKLRWDGGAAEHYFDYTAETDGGGVRTRRVYYPTPASIQVSVVVQCGALLVADSERWFCGAAPAGAGGARGRGRGHLGAGAGPCLVL
jgi:chitinase domain-containing protein 1